jgi:hypothetical protein
MATETLNYTGTLVVHSCPTCGVMHAYPERMDLNARRQKGFNIYCPSGHSWIYSKTIEEDLEEARGEVRYFKSRLQGEQRQHSATKGQLTKTKARIAGGVCPCCHRSFQNLGRHMKGQHPDYATAP